MQVYILNIYAHKSYLGGSSSLPITSEEWSEPDYCGSDGTVQVKCTKLNGKPFKMITVPQLISGKTNGNQEAFSYPNEVT